VLIPSGTCEAVKHSKLWKGFVCTVERCNYASRTEKAMEHYTYVVHKWRKNTGVYWNNRYVQTFFSGADIKSFTVNGPDDDKRC
jgi:hypothetical protein